MERSDLGPRAWSPRGGASFGDRSSGGWGGCCAFWGDCPSGLGGLGGIFLVLLGLGVGVGVGLGQNLGLRLGSFVSKERAGRALCAPQATASSPWYNPPPLCSHRSVQTRHVHVSALLGVFWNHRFCGSNPIDNVVCSVLQAAGRVHVGGKVVV